MLSIRVVGAPAGERRTDLKQTTLGREDGNVSIEPSGSSGHDDDNNMQVSMTMMMNVRRDLLVP